MFFSFLADLVVVMHLAFLVFTLLGQLAILVGLWRGWHWVRNPWFRWSHLLAILFVAGEYMIGIQCPLTDLEIYLRVQGGEKPEETSFIGRMVQLIVFSPDEILNVEHWSLHVGYISFALVVLATFVLAPPRWHTSGNAEPAEMPSATTANSSKP